MSCSGPSPLSKNPFRPIFLAAKLEVKNATLMWPVRIAAAGKLVTPGGAVEICRILGRDETLRRLRAGLEKLA